MVGRVGNDAFGEDLLAGLQADGVDCGGVGVDATSHSGVAVITVDAQGENTIVVIPGANGHVGAAEGDRLGERLSRASILLLQLEVPLAAVVAAATAAQGMGVIVILDPAPAQPLPPELYAAVDILTPNQLEATQLTGIAVTDTETAIQAGQQLRQWGVGIAIVKLGAQGAVCVSATEVAIIPPIPVVAIDTVAAGDAFNGGLAAALATGASLSAALEQATAVAALSVTRPGAQPSLPNQTELAAFCRTWIQSR